MENSMLAAVFKGDGKLILEQRPVPRVRGPRDVLLAVKGVGICGTDLHILEVPPRHPAKADTIMGHEFCGEVLAIGEVVQSVKPGDHVAVDQDAPCGYCEECRRGFPNACTTVLSAPVPGFANTPGIFWDGGLARYAVLQDYMLYPVPSTIPWHHLALAETIACAVNAINKAHPQVGETALVLGAGPVGLLFTSILKASGVRVLVSETAAERRRVAARIGADVVIDPRQQNLAAAVRTETAGKGAEIVMEAVGPLLNECIEAARFGGRIVFFGHDELARAQVAPALIMRKELSIVGAFLAKFTFLPAIRLLERGVLPMDDIVTAVLPLDQIFEAHRRMRAGEVLKIVIDPSH